MAGPRATWKGLLQISLVQIPIKVFHATEASATIAFNQLHDPCQTRIQQRKWCPSCAREVTQAELVKGFEFETGHYVLLSEDELDAVQPPSTKVIELVQIAKASALPFSAIDRAYFLAPDGDAASAAYDVLCSALTGLVGIGKLAIYGREYLVAVGPSDHALCLYTLHHAAEQREAPYVRPRGLRDSAETHLAAQIVERLTRPLQLDRFVDAYQADVRRIIDAKIAGSEIVIPPVAAAPNVLSLQEALTQSLLALKAAKAIPAKASRSVSPKRKRALWLKPAS